MAKLSPLLMTSASFVLPTSSKAPAALTLCACPSFEGLMFNWPVVLLDKLRSLVGIRPWQASVGSWSGLSMTRGPASTNVKRASPTEELDCV